MKTFMLLGGGTMTAENAGELVSKLNENSIFGSKESLQKFMDSTAKACKIYSGAVIRTKNYVLFVEDLKRHGFLEEVR
jgi:hypothetical protein